MGSKDKIFGIVVDIGAGLTHTTRLEIGNASTGEAEAFPAGHSRVDVHSVMVGESLVVQDVPLTAADRAAYFLILKSAQVFQSNPAGFFDVMGKIIEAAWGLDVRNAAMAQIADGVTEATEAYVMSAFVDYLVAQAVLCGVE